MAPVAVQMVGAVCCRRGMPAWGQVAPHDETATRRKYPASRTALSQRWAFGTMPSQCLRHPKTTTHSGSMNAESFEHCPNGETQMCSSLRIVGCSSTLHSRPIRRHSRVRRQEHFGHIVAQGMWTRRTRRVRARPCDAKPAVRRGRASAAQPAAHSTFGNEEDATRGCINLFSALLVTPLSGREATFLH